MLAALLLHWAPWWRLEPPRSDDAMNWDLNARTRSAAAGARGKAGAARGNGDRPILRSGAWASSRGLLPSCGRAVICGGRMPARCAPAPVAVADRRLLDGVTEIVLDADLAAGLDPAGDDAHFMDELRRFRRRHCAHRLARHRRVRRRRDRPRRTIVLADVCIRAACRRAGTALATRHGLPVGADGTPLELLVLGMGKLGGGELNFRPTSTSCSCSGAR